MFLTEDDYRVVCDEDELDILTRSEPETRQKAERVAMEEVASYLRPRYDTEKAFAAEGDLALDGRQELYDNAIAWLTRVSKGGSMPNLPTYTGEDGETDTSNPIRYGGMSASKYDY